MEQVLIRLDPTLLRALDEHRTRDYPYKSRAAVMRAALDEYLQRHPATVPAAKVAAKAKAPLDWR